MNNRIQPWQKVPGENEASDRNGVSLSSEDQVARGPAVLGGLENTKCDGYLSDFF